MNTVFGSFRNKGAYWIILSFLVVVFLMGGGSRPDIQSLVILRPLCAIFLGWAVWSLTRKNMAPYRFLAIISISIVALIVIHLIPLPPEIWHSLPGRGFVAEIDRTISPSPPWRPITLSPGDSWNALYSLVVPLAALAMIANLQRDDLFRLLVILVSFGLLTGLLGFLQAIGPQNGPAYLYRISNFDSAVGLFANRNHQAVYLACLFPMLAVYASTSLRTVEQARFRQILSVGFAALLIPLLLVTGSRAGLVVGMVGLASVPLLYKSARFERPAKRRFKKVDLRYVLAAIAILALVALSIALSRAEAIDRLLATNQPGDLRFTVWGPVFDMALKYLPIGSGIGSFAAVYQVDEPALLLKWAYMNHAHNEFLEIFLTGGIPALLLCTVAVAAWVRVTIYVFTADRQASRDIVFGRLGAILIFMLALASTVDYPLRVPIISCVLVISATWMANAWFAKTSGSDRRAGLAIRPPQTESA